MPPDDPRSDDELVAAIDRGETSAFDILYHRHREWVLRLAVRFMGHQDDALDVLQETFAYFARKFPGFRLTARLTSFLYPVVKNLSIDVARRRARWKGEVPEVEDPSKGEEPWARSELAALLRSLPEGQREVVLLRFIDDLPLDEIAEILRIPTGTVKSRLHQAMTRMRQDPTVRRYFDR